MIEIRPGFERLLAALDRHGIPYAVGGSLASSVHGVPRSTVDIDLVVEMKQTEVGDFVAELRDAFYADEEMIRSALASKRSFNLIDMASGYKFDLFPLPDGLYYQTEFQRRAGVEYPLGTTLLRFSVVSPEDSILTKLVWFRAGGEVSDRQWSDVRGILEVQGARLDRNYLERWGRHLEIADLVARLFGGA
ncbi:MAG: hypothetical protein O2968_06265 [Acidobacteria bacterium]|nr:hypothetical protein [Acidobacteriota bacterium]